VVAKAEAQAEVERGREVELPSTIINNWTRWGDSGWAN